MPTPSSNAPDPTSPRSFPFSSCPEPDELQTLQTPPQSVPERAPSPPSPSSWHPHPPPPYSVQAADPAIMDDDAEASRSATMSPSPQSRSDDNEDHDMEPQQGPEGMVDATLGDTEDSSHKQSDIDEDMLEIAGNEPGHGQETRRQTDSRDSSSETRVAAPRRTRTADTSASSRGVKHKADLISPVTPGELDDLDMWDLAGNAPRWIEDSGLVGIGYEYSQMRVIPTSPSSFLRPGSRFTGTQQSERQRYDVQVEIKHVDLRESFLCGYLRIQGLTDDHPTLTTYFEGEIIGTKYGFLTQHPSWGATEKIDLSHWAKFTAFRPFQKQARKGGQVLIKDVAQRENIFMRWKEHFLVPDHRVRTINGASFEGFYYICFNQVRGEVSGIYFHSKSEKFQQLELKHVKDKGCFGAMEFR
ncbi:glucose-induced degradation protein 4 [Diplogelasinospora grovesii]|uniref:Glucose-induced degradation protein 4 n=1 Tax=Diplogelasinospora grovesii TaxID=303347 RepID=A0AAN6N430_9PEZI|nr:glucose-induced degradation protein 4 [Diplogelasinospora grovesii]